MARLQSTLVFISAACLSLAGCNTVTPTSPLKTEALSAQQSVYTGSIVDSTKGTGTLVISVSSGGGMTGGTWAMTFGGRTETDVVSGTVNGSSYAATVSQCVETDFSGCVPNCRLSFAGSLTGTAISGAYSAVKSSQCPDRAGTVDAKH